MKKSLLQILGASLLMLFSISPQMRADYVSYINDGYYRIVSAASNFGTNKYSIYISSGGDIGWTAYNDQDITQVFRVTNDNTFTFDLVAHQQIYIQNIGSNFYMGPSNVSSGMGADATTSSTPNGITVTYSSATPQIILMPVRADKSGVGQMLTIDNANNTSGGLRQTSWLNASADAQTCCWYFETVSEDDANKFLASVDPLLSVLEAEETAYNTLVASDVAGYYVKENVEAFKKLYAEDKAITEASDYSSKSTADKQTLADALSAAYSTAISQRNLITDGYYRIVSAYSGFSSNKKALNVSSNNLMWGDYDANDAKQLFYLTGSTSFGNDNSTTAYSFSVLNPFSSTYIGQSSGQMGGTPQLSSTTWQTAFTAIPSAQGQFGIQPIWSGTITMSMCLGLNNTSASSGSLNQNIWFGGLSDGCAQAWSLESVSADEAQAIIDATDPLKIQIADLENAYNTLESSDEFGYYKKENVEAFKKLYEDDKKLSDAGTLSLEEKTSYATALNSSYATAVSEFNSGYFRIVSSASDYSDSKKVISIVDSALCWVDYNANDAKQLFLLTDAKINFANDNGNTGRRYTALNPASGLYIAQSTNQMHGAPQTSESSWLTVFTRIPQSSVWGIQPDWVASGVVSQCIGINSSTTNSLKQDIWYAGITSGSIYSWSLELVSATDAEKLLAEKNYSIEENVVKATGEVTLSTLKDYLSTQSDYTSVDLSNASSLTDLTADSLSAILPANVVAIVSATSDIKGTNIINNGTCEELKLTDGNTFAAPQSEFTANAVTYNRNMTTNWGTIYLPYAVSPSTDIELFVVKGVSSNAITVESVETLSANTPALVHKVGSTNTISLGLNTATTITGAQGTSGSEIANAELIGVYERTQISEGATNTYDYYYLNGDAFNHINQYFFATPFRAYLRTTGTIQSPSFKILVDDDPTGINNALNDGDNEIEGVYSVSGVKQSTLLKGINIIKYRNGKTQKVILK